MRVNIAVASDYTSFPWKLVSALHTGEYFLCKECYVKNNFVCKMLAVMCSLHFKALAVLKLSIMSLPFYQLSLVFSVLLVFKVDLFS